MLLMIDNYDSFTWNLVQYLQALGAEVRVERNDALSVDEIEALAPRRIVISPGPCTPNEAGVSLELIERLGATTPEGLEVAAWDETMNKGRVLFRAVAEAARGL